MEVLILNEYFNEEEDAAPVKKAKKQRISLHSYCMLPRGKTSMTDEWSKQKVHIPRTSALPAQLAPVAIASALQGSIQGDSIPTPSAKFGRCFPSHISTSAGPILIINRSSC